MNFSLVQAKVVTERIAWVHQMIGRIGTLPLDTFDAFEADRRNVASAESYLRRALEALLDLGRHILAKGFGQVVVEYKEVARQLEHVGVLDREQGALLRTLAGYRNRLVHFYDEVTDLELYGICTRQLGDVDTILAAMVAWIEAHPELIDRSL
jgi:uncharacterized protein YutE (UPF0331/DUF86 family)